MKLEWLAEGVLDKKEKCAEDTASSAADWHLGKLLSFHETQVHKSTQRYSELNIKSELNLSTSSNL